MWKRRAVSAVGFVILLTTTSFAGNLLSFVCQNEKCGFKGQVMFGGGFFVREVRPAYCAECGKFVNLSWPREDKNFEKQKPAPTLLGRMWIPSTGKTVEIYACPHCGKPVIPLKSPRELTRCPKCGESTLKTRAKGTWD